MSVLLIIDFSFDDQRAIPPSRSSAYPLFQLRGLKEHGRLKGNRHSETKMSWRSLSVLLALVALPRLDACAQDAATAFQRSCGGCHPSVSVLARKIKGANAAGRKTYLTAFLKSHHTPDPAVVDQIIAFVLAPPAK